MEVKAKTWVVVGFCFGGSREWLEELVKLVGWDAWSMVSNGQEYVLSLLCGGDRYGAILWTELDCVSKRRVNELFELFGLDGHTEVWLDGGLYGKMLRIGCWLEIAEQCWDILG